MKIQAFCKNVHFRADGVYWLVASYSMMVASLGERPFAFFRDLLKFRYSGLTVSEASQNHSFNR